MAYMQLRLPRGLAEKLEREARRQGHSLEEYVLDLLMRDLDPEEQAHSYIEAARSLLQQAWEELARGDVRQAAEKAWGAAALAIKAYAAWREGIRLRSHGELWDHMRKLAGELGSWVRTAWMYATGMHVCFYEGWCSREDVEDALRHVEKLVDAIEERITRGDKGRGTS